MGAVTRGSIRLVRPSASDVHTAGRTTPSIIAPITYRMTTGGGFRSKLMTVPLRFDRSLTRPVMDGQLCAVAQQVAVADLVSFDRQMRAHPQVVEQLGGHLGPEQVEAIVTNQ